MEQANIETGKEKLKKISKLTPIVSVYEYFQRALTISARTLQWYATDGLIPKPIKKGRDAFYDLEKTQLKSRLHIINTLQKNFEMRLWQIREILSKYEKQDLGKLRLLLDTLHEDYPRYRHIDFDQIEQDAHNCAVHSRFLNKLDEGTPIEKLSLVDVEKEVDAHSKKEEAPF